MAYTEHGALMAASVLNSAVAVQTSVFVVRAFVRMREALALNTEVLHKLDELERRIDGHEEGIRAIVETIRRLTAPPTTSPRKIGFRTHEDAD